jgi:hypothetical protein
MICIENRGKSLTFIKLCEDWDISWRYEKSDNSFNKIILTYNKNPELTWVVDYGSMGDKWGNLIDIVVEFKYNNLEYFK